MRTPHDKTLGHVRAARLIGHMVSRRGSTTEANASVARRLGMTTVKQLNAARRHTRTCSSLNGLQVAYRPPSGRTRKGQMVLLDRTGHLIGRIKPLTPARARPVVLAAIAVLHRGETERGRVVADLDALADEATANGDVRQAVVYGRMAVCVATTGTFDPRTIEMAAAIGIEIAA